jgi:hypothetical protein
MQNNLGRSDRGSGGDAVVFHSMDCFLVSEYSVPGVGYSVRNPNLGCGGAVVVLGWVVSKEIC